TSFEVLRSALYFTMSANAAGLQASSEAAITPAIPNGISFDFMPSSSLVGSSHYATAPRARRQSQSLDQLGAVDHVTGVTEIADLEQAVLRPIQKDEIKRRAAGIVGMVDQHGRPALDQTRHQLPIGRLAVIGEVTAGLAAAVEPRAVHHLHPHLVGQNRAQG